MPELPEVETTVRGLKKEVLGLKVCGVWTDLNSNDKRKVDDVANPFFFKTFRKGVVGRKIVSVERRAKNILINLSGGKTILIHMKMTGHLLYGKYKFKDKKWTPVNPGPLSDPFNRFVHLVFMLSNKKHLAFSDSRKFGKVTLVSTKEAHKTKHLRGLGPEPLDNGFKHFNLKERLMKKPNGKIKTVLMDQTIVTGIGNIYSDEILWETGVKPDRLVKTLKDTEIIKIHRSMKKLLSKGINLGGDSMSDYRNVYGEKGGFQIHHKAYRRTGDGCKKRSCGGVIIRSIINGRSAHYCSLHQK